MEGGLPEVSVVVAAHNAELGIPELLRRLERQTLDRARFEVIVVDDSSSDATARVAGGNGARVVRSAVRSGSYAARNLGLAEASGSTIAITDADCRPAPDWLERGLEALEGGADLVGGRIELPLGERPTLAELIDVARGLDQERCVLEWGFAATANFFARRDVFEQVGRFNPRLVSGGDNEFSRRATAAGFRLAYAPNAVVVHEPRSRARQVAKKAFRVGFGSGQMRYVAEGPARDWPALWRHPRSYRPRRGLLGVERLTRAGYRPSPLRRVVLDVAQYVLFQLPLVAGSLTAALRRGRGL